MRPLKPPATATGGPATSLSLQSLIAIMVTVSMMTTLISHVSMHHIPTMSGTSLLSAGRGMPLSLPERNASTMQTWLTYLRASGAMTHLQTKRTACRELEAGAQTCLFTGVSCIDVRQSASAGRPLVYILDATQKDNTTVSSDTWCDLRQISADPRYFSTRHWPILDDVTAPRQSCLNAKYRHPDLLGRHINASAEGEDPSVFWLPSLSLIDLDYASNSHNNHLVKDIIWLLDLTLFQASLAEQAHPAEKTQNTQPRFLPHDHVYLPQTREQFIAQTKRDVNRLTYSLILGKNPETLYAAQTATNLTEPSTTRVTQPLLSAYPELNEQLIFHGDKQADNTTDLVCTAQLTVGAKIGNGAHERVCRHIRTASYALYGIQRPGLRLRGQIRFPQPEASILVLDRHLTRKIGNAQEIVKALRGHFEPLGFEVRYETTAHLRTAEDFVRLYSSAGVIVSPHGSHNMGLYWMQRYSALIEAMPVGYTDYAFNLLAESCKIWYYELQSAVPKNLTSYYEKECGKHRPHMLHPCTQVKSKDVWVDTTELILTVQLALERLGYDTYTWLKPFREDGPPPADVIDDDVANGTSGNTTDNTTDDTTDDESPPAKDTSSSESEVVKGDVPLVPAVNTTYKVPVNASTLVPE